MLSRISKLLLVIVGISSPFITTLYLTNAPKTPQPFKENIEIKPIPEIEEEDKVFISDGQGEGTGEATVGGSSAGWGNEEKREGEGESGGKQDPEAGKDTVDKSDQERGEQKQQESKDQSDQKDGGQDSSEEAKTIEPEQEGAKNGADEQGNPDQTGTNNSQGGNPSGTMTDEELAELLARLINQTQISIDKWNENPKAFINANNLIFNTAKLGSALNNLEEKNLILNR
ncbi:hypothetical protein [Candidatus Mycoplasma haematohominis]|uniref:Uncharacterized protein n=1 Tax=Candidatus Mycoplasma haematohominis TaxID=1494318 RepID=A0A478FSU4_9MOLU|nr:hypothetical protein [Candidatus Mycoplasma haemohominis]GCE63456.1 hypothetical protein MHSWG343_04530 [Candidatus Mycoplasma haemohominis]